MKQFVIREYAPRIWLPTCCKSQQQSPCKCGSYSNFDCSSQLGWDGLYKTRVLGRELKVGQTQKGEAGRHKPEG